MPLSGCEEKEKLVLLQHYEITGSTLKKKKNQLKESDLTLEPNDL